MDNSNGGSCPGPDDIAGAHQPHPLSVDVNPKGREEAPETADQAAGVIQQNSALAGRKVDMPKRCFIWDHAKEVSIKGKLHWACSRCPQAYEFVLMPQGWRFMAYDKARKHLRVEHKIDETAPEDDNTTGRNLTGTADRPQLPQSGTTIEGVQGMCQTIQTGCSTSALSNPQAAGISTIGGDEDSPGGSARPQHDETRLSISLQGGERNSKRPRLSVDDVGVTDTSGLMLNTLHHSQSHRIPSDRLGTDWRLPPPQPSIEAITAFPTLHSTRPPSFTDSTENRRMPVGIVPGVEYTSRGLQFDNPLESQVNPAVQQAPAMSGPQAQTFSPAAPVEPKLRLGPNNMFPAFAIECSAHRRTVQNNTAVPCAPGSSTASAHGTENSETPDSVHTVRVLFHRMMQLNHHRACSTHENLNRAAQERARADQDAAERQKQLDQYYNEKIYEEWQRCQENV